MFLAQFERDFSLPANNLRVLSPAILLIKLISGEKEFDIFNLGHEGTFVVVCLITSLQEVQSG